MRCLSRSALCVLAIALVLLGCGGETAEPASPADVQALIEQGRAAIDRRDYAAAIADLERAVRGNAKSAEARFLLGNAYAQSDQLDRAATELAEAVRLDGDHTDARSNLGVVYYRQGKLAEAQQAFEGALRQAPDDARVSHP